MKALKHIVDPVIFLLVVTIFIVIVGDFQNISHERTYKFAVTFDLIWNWVCTKTNTCFHTKDVLQT